MSDNIPSAAAPQNLGVRIGGSVAILVVLLLIAYLIEQPDGSNSTLVMILDIAGIIGAIAFFVFGGRLLARSNATTETTPKSRIL